jgi:hypothetical protein
MECVTSISFSVLVNGGKTKQCASSRGLSQDDQLSPYLFILCHEVLSWLIYRSFMDNDIRGVKMNLAGPAFTHVMYVDDVMMFARANSLELAILDHCIETYCSWFGQRINRGKFGVIFFKLVHGVKRKGIKLLLQMKRIQPLASCL